MSRSGWPTAASRAATFNAFSTVGGSGRIAGESWAAFQMVARVLRSMRASASARYTMSPRCFPPVARTDVMVSRVTVGSRTERFAPRGPARRYGGEDGSLHRHSLIPQSKPFLPSLRSGA